MICAQIMAEYEKQTKLYDLILQELKALNDIMNQHVIEKTARNHADPPGRLLTIQETAKFLGISRSTIYNRISQYSKNPFPVKPKRIGRRVMFDRNDLENYLNSL